MINTDNKSEEQKRIHADIYYDKLTSEQSRYVAMHVGLFWGIGRFIIKNEDVVEIMIDSPKMYEHLTKRRQVGDSFASSRTDFFKKLIEQRKLKVKYKKIVSEDNLASKIIDS